MAWHLEVRIVECSSYQGLPSGSSPICSTSSAAKRRAGACLSDEQPFWMVGGRDSQGFEDRRGHTAAQKETEDSFPASLQSLQVLEIASSRNVQVLQDWKGSLLMIFEAMCPLGDQHSDQGRCCQPARHVPPTDCLSPVCQRGKWQEWPCSRMVRMFMK